MPFPIILIEKQNELGRAPGPEDFTAIEREEICACLASCIRETERMLEMIVTVPSLRRNALSAADTITSLQDDYELFALAVDG